jgi:hypothetical protein
MTSSLAPAVSTAAPESDIVKGGGVIRLGDEIDAVE